LGRTAAYDGQPVYWHQIVNTDKKLEAKLEGLID